MTYRYRWAYPLWPVLGALLFMVLLSTPGWGQEPTLQLSLRRDWGYGGLAGRIEGLFSLRVEAPPEVVRVQFFLDDQLIGEDTEPPFRYQFRTGDYPLGPHRLTAVGFTADGRQLQANVLERTFVSPSEGWQTAWKIVGPLLALSALFVLLSVWVERRRGYRPGRGYGLAGGAVCPRCGRPFARHWWAPNLGLHKFDRCPHCGAWSIVAAASAQELAAAERRWATPTAAEPAGADDEWRRRLEESRYQDSP
ncbi:MAG: Ig-like domain-containing protein [Caldilineales bacterium]|nr:Ig-like domain-containing protein [Caldilineales bacterium]